MSSHGKKFIDNFQFESSHVLGLCAFLVALFQILGTGLALVVVDKFGRRILLVLSEICMCLTMAALGAYFYLDENKKEKCLFESVSRHALKAYFDVTTGSFHFTLFQGLKTEAAATI